MYLYTGDWVNAEDEATNIINNSLYDTVSINNVFLKNSKEAIWQLQPTDTGWNTEDARVFIIPSTGPNTGSNTVYLSDSLVNRFEAGDQRKVKLKYISIPVITIYYFPYKYKVKLLIILLVLLI